MSTRTRLVLATAVAAMSAIGCSQTMPSSSSPMTFFVSSSGSGKGADLGGLAGADKICQSLADSAGAGSKRWRAYLSAGATAASPAVNARDRIGAGPWRNVKGEVIATSVADLHSANNKLTKQTGLTEKGTIIPGRGDTPNQHDILTGSTADGMLSAGQTCNNWTSSTDGVAMLGHLDRMGPAELATASSWNAAHPSRGGCSQTALISTGGAGLLYCFAAD